ncbi:low affinity immunoglobulin gamma Fc region receptor IV-like isoform X2 [Nannospalax galili]|uniref:Fc receptor, IgG, low affinity IV n=1 Tax=Nannospalax galili TaxID=1026970 RepID=A0A8C6RS42_NANGA|nr:low affinity immunoglobulin gamma Fc region receptor IV-like isoform X2 [Nannospalax galili]
MWQLVLPTALLLLVSSGVRADRQKAVVILDPEWVRVLQEDNVTLRCQGAYPPGDNSTEWFYNGSLISHKDSIYFIKNSRVSNSGEYRCRTGLSLLSDPVQLEVHMGWLLLQTSQWVFQEGEPIRLKCHSWRNKPVYKVMYLQNGKSKRYFPQNSEFYIPEATQDHSGSYFCRGMIGRNNKSSDTVKIIVQGPTSPSITVGFPPWHQITFCLLIGLMFVVDTVLYFFVQRNLRSSMKSWKESKFQWNRDPQDK